MASTIELSLFGQKLVLKHRAEPGDDPELARRAVKLVSERVAEAQSRARGVAPHQVALLALLDLAGDYLRAKDRTGELLDDLRARADALAKGLKEGATPGAGGSDE